MVAKKERERDEYVTHLYVHINELVHFTLFSGMTVQHFLRSTNLSSLLLLKHSYEDASFNIHTQFDFIIQSQFSHFLKEIAENPSALCFVDFTDERSLNKLSPEEQAELLYISHKKEAYKTPFYRHLQNRYVYLTDNNQDITKIYFREMKDLYELIGSFFNQHIQESAKSTSFWRKKTNRVLPELSTERILELADSFEDGALLSLYKVNKTKYELEIRSLPDNIFPDEVFEDIQHLLKRPVDMLIEV